MADWQAKPPTDQDKQQLNAVITHPDFFAQDPAEQIQALRGTPYFSGAPDAAISRLLSNAPQQLVDAGKQRRSTRLQQASQFGGPIQEVPTWNAPVTEILTGKSGAQRLAEAGNRHFVDQPDPTRAQMDEMQSGSLDPFEKYSISLMGNKEGRKTLQAATNQAATIPESFTSAIGAAAALAGPVAGKVAPYLPRVAGALNAGGRVATGVFTGQSALGSYEAAKRLSEDPSGENLMNLVGSLGLTASMATHMGHSALESYRSGAKAERVSARVQSVAKQAGMPFEAMPEDAQAKTLELAMKDVEAGVKGTKPTGLGRIKAARETAAANKQVDPSVAALRLHLAANPPPTPAPPVEPPVEQPVEQQPTAATPLATQGASPAQEAARLAFLKSLEPAPAPVTPPPPVAPPAAAPPPEATTPEPPVTVKPAMGMTPDAIVQTLKVEADPKKAGDLYDQAVNIGGATEHAARQVMYEQMFGQHEQGSRDSALAEERRRDANNIEAHKQFGKPYDDLGPAARRLVDRNVISDYLSKQGMGEATTPPPPIADATPEPPLRQSVSIDANGNASMAPLPEKAATAAAAAAAPKAEPQKKSEPVAEAPLPKPTPENAQLAGAIAANPEEAPAAPAAEPAKAEENPEPATPAEPEKPGEMNEGTFFPKTAADVPAPHKVVRMRTADLSTDPERFQYKAEGIGAGGVGNSLKQGQAFDQARAGDIHVWRDPDNGKVYVVNGHHRHDLATRSGTEAMNTMFIDAPNAAEARMQGAILNMSDDKGTPVDAAKLFREGGFTPQMFDRFQLKPNNKVVSLGMQIAKLSDPLFQRVINGDLTHERAAIIGRELGDDPVQQDGVLNLIQKSEDAGKEISDTKLENLIKLAKRRKEQGLGVKKDDGAQMDMFGRTDQERSTLLDEATLMDNIGRRIGSEKRLFGALSKDANVKKVAAAGNVIVADKNQGIADMAKQAQAIWVRLKDKSGPIANILDGAGRELANGAKVSAIEDRVYGQVRDAIVQELGGKPGAGANGPTGSPKGGGENPGPGANGRERESGNGQGQGLDLQRQRGKRVDEMSMPEAIEAFRQHEKVNPPSESGPSKKKVGSAPPVDEEAYARDQEAARFKDWYNQAVAAGRGMAVRPDYPAAMDSLPNLKKRLVDLEDAAAQAFTDYRAGKITKEQHDKAHADLMAGNRQYRAALESTPISNDPRQAIADLGDILSVKNKASERIAKEKAQNDNTIDVPSMDAQYRLPKSHWIDPKGKAIEVDQHEDFASDYLGVDRDNPDLAMNKLYDKGWVRTYGANVTIGDLSKTSKTALDSAMHQALENENAGPKWGSGNITVEVEGVNGGMVSVPKEEVGDFLRNPRGYMQRNRRGGMGAQHSPSGPDPADAHNTPPFGNATPKPPVRPAMEGQESLFGEETPKISQSQASAEKSAKDKLEADRLAAEFNSPINAGNRRTKLKPAPKPVQESMFAPAPESSKQGGFDFQRELFDKGIKQKLGQPFDVNDNSKSIEKSNFRYYPANKTLPARIYVDEVGVQILRAIHTKLSGQETSPIDGVAIGNVTAKDVVSLLRRGPKGISEKARAQLYKLADAISDGIDDNQNGVTVIRGTSGKPIWQIRDTVKHEASHVEQYGIASGRKLPLLDYNQVSEIPNYSKAALALHKQGYNIKNRDTVVKEILSTAAERAGYSPITGKNELGLNVKEMADLTRAILDKAVAIHGTEAYNLIRHASPSFRKAVLDNATPAPPVGKHASP